MPREIELFDGSVLEFPDDTPDHVLQATAKRLTQERWAERDARARQPLPEGVAPSASGGGRGSAAGPTAANMREFELSQMGPVARTAARAVDGVKKAVGERWSNPEALASANPLLGSAVNATQGAARDVVGRVRTLADSMTNPPAPPAPAPVDPKGARADAPFANRQEAIDDAVDRIALGADPAKVFEAFKAAGITQDEIVARGRELNTGGLFNDAQVQPPRRTAAENRDLAARPQGEMRSLRREGGTVASGASDIGAAGIGGVVTGFKMIADALPTGGETRLSRGLESAGLWVDSLRTAASKADEDQVSSIMDAAKDKGVGQQIAAAAQAFGVSPAEMIAQGLGTSVPAILAALLPGVRESVLGSLAATAGTGAVMGAGAVRGSIFDEVKQALVNQGMPRQEAEDRAEAARAYLGKNGDQIALGAGLGAIASIGGVESAAIGSIRKILGKKGAEIAETRILPAAALGAVTEAIPEIAQGGQEKLATNLALGREGFNVDPLQGVAGAAALEGAAGMGAGAAAGAAGAALNRRDVPGELTALRNLYTPTRAMPPVEFRAETLRVFDQVGAAFGLNPKAAKAVREKAETLPADQVPGFLERATQSLNKAGMFTKPVTDPEVEALLKALAPIADEGKAMDALNAARRADEQAVRDFSRPPAPAAAAAQAQAMPVDTGTEAAAAPVDPAAPAGPEPGDILTAAGNPFATERSARAAAKKVEGAEVVPVDGGFVVRKPVTVQDVHAAADARGIPWDEDPSFMRLTWEVTGKERLDDLAQPELRAMLRTLEQMGQRTDAATAAAQAAPAGTPGAVPEGQPPADAGTTASAAGPQPVGGAVDSAAAPAAEAPVARFTTAKGSTYEVHADGTTTRDKAARNDVGHEGDSGKKARSATTVYVDGDASALSAAGLSNLGPKGARVVVQDGKATLLTWNESAGKWGAAPSARDIPVSTTPKVGASPLELWSPADDVPGVAAFRNMHAGNRITAVEPAEQSTQPPVEVGSARPSPAEQAEGPAAAAPQPTTQEAPDVRPDVPARGPAAEPAAGAASGGDQQPGGERPAQPDAVDGQRVGDGPAGPAAGGEAAAAVPGADAADQALSEAGPAPAPATGRTALGPTVSLKTKSGKTLTGWVRSDLTPEQAQEVDPYTYKVKDHGGGWFIRERHADALAEKFPPKAADAAAPAPTADVRSCSSVLAPVAASSLPRRAASASTDESGTRADPAVKTAPPYRTRSCGSGASSIRRARASASARLGRRCRSRRAARPHAA